MDICITKLLTGKSVYWVDINADIKKHIQNSATCLECQQTQPMEKIIHQKIPLRPWDVPGTDIFHFNNKKYLCIVNYPSKFPMVKRLEGLSAENLITTVKVIFREYGILHKLMSDAGTNFVSDKFWKFCNSINIEQVVLSAYHHQNNGQGEVHKMNVQKCTDSGGDINLTLLQISTTSFGQGLLSLGTLMFNWQVFGIMLVLDQRPVGKDYDDEHHSKLLDRQHKNNDDALPIFVSIPIGSAVVVQWEDGRPWTHGTIVDTGDHNHHGHAYIIQLTTNDRRITCNRWHIKPTSVTANAYLWYQITKHSNTWTDPLEDILKCISNNPMAYGNMHTCSNNIHKTQYHQQTKNTQPGRGQDHSQQSSEVVNKDHRHKNMNPPEDNEIVQRKSEVVKTRCGQTVREPYRLSYT